MILVGDTVDFPIDIGLDEGLELSPFFFFLTIVIDELTRGIQDQIPWCMLFSGDIVLLDKIRERVNTKLEWWGDTLKVKDFRLSRSKTEYLQCRFSAREDDLQKT